MQKHLLALAGAIVLTAAAVFGIGAYIKFYILKPAGLAGDTSIMAVPFVYMADPGLRRSAADAKLPPDEPPVSAEPPVPSVPDEPAVTEPVVSASSDASKEPTSSMTDLEPTPTVSSQPDMSSDTAPSAPEPVIKPPVLELAETEVPPEWYSDVLFIGDSRMAELRDYARKEGADYFCDVGMSSFDCMKRELSDKNFPTQKLESLLGSKKYGKIFINLGLNESGYPIKSLMKAYTELVETVRSYQPDAVIILHGIMTVSEKASQTEWYYKPSNLFSINERIAALADGKTVFYMDINAAYADENGYLKPELSSDGFHLYAKYSKDWASLIGRAAAWLGI